MSANPFEARIVLAERDILNECYDGVFDPNAWKRIAAIIDYHCPELFSAFQMEATGPGGNVHQIHALGFDPDIIGRYPQYADLNPFRPAILSTPVGGIGLSCEYSPPNDIVRTPFYSDILKPVGDLRIGMGVALARQPNAFAVLALHHNHALAEQTLGPAHQLLRRTAEHLHRAFQLSIRAETLTRRVAEESLVANLALPALATDDAARIVRHNAAAEPIFLGGIRRDRTGKIHLPRYADCTAVEAAILRSARDNTAVSVEVTAWNGCALSLHCVPLRITEHNGSPLQVFSAEKAARVLVYVTGFRPTHPQVEQ